MNESWMYVNVHPKAAKNVLVSMGHDRFEAWVKATPVDGQANKAVMELLGRYLGLAPERLKLVKGGASRHKIFKVYG